MQGFFLGLDFALPLLDTLAPVWVFRIITHLDEVSQRKKGLAFREGCLRKGFFWV